MGIGRGAQEREKNPNRKCAFEKSVIDYAERKTGLVVNPSVGTSFDTIQEAYDFYNLYSWETGFELAKLLEKVGGDRDGKGLEERLKMNETAEPLINIVAASGPAISGDRNSATFSAPMKKRPGGEKGGRPTTSRDKPPYEMPVKRTRFCSICRQKGHKSTTCPNRGDIPKNPRKAPRCSQCGLTGHRKNTCGKPMVS